jgi:hypothetical protein
MLLSALRRGNAARERPDKDQIEAAETLTEHGKSVIINLCRYGFSETGFAL